MTKSIQVLIITLLVISVTYLVFELVLPQDTFYVNAIFYNLVILEIIIGFSLVLGTGSGKLHASGAFATYQITVGVVFTVLSLLALIVISFLDSYVGNLEQTYMAIVAALGCFAFLSIYILAMRENSEQKASERAKELDAGYLVDRIASVVYGLSKIKDDDSEISKLKKSLDISKQKVKLHFAMVAQSGDEIKVRNDLLKVETAILTIETQLVENEKTNKESVDELGFVVNQLGKI